MGSLWLATWLAVAAVPVTVLEIQVDGDAAAVAPPLARRLATHGAVGELVVQPGRLWLVASSGPGELTGAFGRGELRFAPAFETPEPGTVPRLYEPPVKGREAPKTWHVREAEAMHPRLVEVKASVDMGGHPVVSATFDEAGKAEFHALTKRLVGQKLAILVDEQVMSVPVVREPIPGGRVMVTLGAPGRSDEAEQFAARLRGGALPVNVALLRTLTAERSEVDGTTTVSDTPLRYPTPKRWHPAACALSQRDDCHVLVVPAQP